MGIQYYLADTKHKRRLWLGNQLGAFITDWLRHAPTPFEADLLRIALDRFGRQDAERRRYEHKPELLDRFAVKVWAFCITAEDTYEIRVDNHEYEDEFLPSTHPWNPLVPDPTWTNVGSWYVREKLDPDPLAESMTQLETQALSHPPVDR